METSRLDGSIHPLLNEAASLWSTAERIAKFQSVARSADSLDRQHAVQLLSYYREALPLVREALHDQAPGVRAAAITALAQLRDNRSVPLIRNAYDDSSPLVQIAAEWALIELGLEPVGAKEHESQIKEMISRAIPFNNDEEEMDEQDAAEFLNRLSSLPSYSTESASLENELQFPSTPHPVSLPYLSIHSALQHLRHALLNREFYTSYLVPLAEPSIIGGHNQRAKAYGCIGKLSSYDIRQLYDQWNGECYWCGGKPPEEETHVDHYIPLSKQGPNTCENLVVTCADCNHRKSDKDPLKFAIEIGKSESPERLQSILLNAGIPLDSYKTTRRDRKKPELVMHISYSSRYESYVFAPSAFRAEVRDLFVALPFERRQFHSFGASEWGRGRFTAFWVAHDSLFNHIVQELRDADIKLAFVVPTRANSAFSSLEGIGEFKRAVYNALTRKRRGKQK